MSYNQMYINIGDDNMDFYRNNSSFIVSAAVSREFSNISKVNRVIETINDEIATACEAGDFNTSIVFTPEDCKIIDENGILEDMLKKGYKYKVTVLNDSSSRKYHISWE